MALTSGLAGQFGFVAETTYGTPVTVTRFVPLVDESVQTEIDKLESEGIIAGARVLRSQQWSQGYRRSEGDVGMEVYDRSIGLLLHHALGTVATSGAGPYTHTFTPGDLAGKGLTMQFGRPNRNGTVIPFTYAGGKIQSWEIAVAAGEIATFGITAVAQTETNGITLASANYATSIRPMTFVNGSFTLGSSSLCVRSAQISGENRLSTDRTCIGQNFIDEPTEADLREYTGEIEVEFYDLSLYNRFLQGTEAAMSLVLSAPGTATLTVAANVRTDGETPNIEGRDLLVHTLNFKCVGTNSDASAITMTFVNNDTTP
jgi:hypothetical protein